MQRTPLNLALLAMALLPSSAVAAKSDSRADAAEAKAKGEKKGDAKDKDAKPLPAPAKEWTVSNASSVKLISAIGRAGGPAPGETLLVSFDAPNAFGVSDTSSGKVITDKGSIGGVRAAPAGNSSVYRSLGADSQSTFDFSGWAKGAPLASLSFEWGSIDSYNFVDFLNRKGETVWTTAGTDMPKFNGDQSAQLTNQRLLVSFQREADIAGVRMRSKGSAFEFDSLAGAASTGAVPEPASWLMMIIGFGFIGHGLRRKRSRAVSA